MHGYGSEGIWSANGAALGEEELQQVTQLMLEWFSRKAN